MTYEIDLNMQSSGVMPRIKVSQYDNEIPQISATLYNGSSSLYMIPSGAKVFIEGTKPDRKGFSYAAKHSGSTITADIVTQMCTTVGDVQCEFVIKDGDKRKGTQNFVIEIESAGLAEDTDISETDLPAIIEGAYAQMEAAERAAGESAKSAGESAASAASASEASQSAMGHKETSEAWAVGTRGGVPVESSDEAYENNSKHHAGKAATAAADASGFSLDAKNSAKEAAAWSAHPPYIGENGNWWVYNITSGGFEDSGIDASITVQIADITMIDASEKPYVTNTGTSTDAVFHLFIPRGNGIAGISKTGTSGLVDTYTIAFSDGAETTFSVTNGEKGDTGTGVQGAVVAYQQSSSGTAVPTGEWVADPPQVAKGSYLWTRTVTSYTDGTSSTAYSISYMGRDGSGAGDMQKSVYDTDDDGKVDAAENSDTVGGHTVGADVPGDAAFTDTTYTDFIGATAEASGAAGLVPAPAAGSTGKALLGDGSWGDIPGISWAASESEASSEMKVATCTSGDFLLQPGAAIAVEFAQGNSAKTIYIKVGDTKLLPVHTMSEHRVAPIGPGGIYLLVCIGQQYQLLQAVGAQDSPTQDIQALAAGLYPGGMGTRTTTFNSDGSITEALGDLSKKTVFESDGSITETYLRGGAAYAVKKTTFAGDGSITETVSAPEGA